MKTCQGCGRMLKDTNRYAVYCLVCISKARRTHIPEPQQSISPFLTLPNPTPPKERAWKKALYRG